MISFPIDLAPDWRLNRDSLQWVIENRQGQRWRPVSFAVERSTIYRVLHDERVSATQEALENIAALPERFGQR